MEIISQARELTEAEERELGIARERLAKFDQTRLGSTLEQFKAWRKQNASDLKIPCPSPQHIR